MSDWHAKTLEIQLTEWRENRLQANDLYNPELLFIHCEELLATGEVTEADIREAMVPKRNIKEINEVTTTSQTARFFSVAAKGGNITWAPVLGAVAGASLFNALTLLYNKHRFAELEAQQANEPTIDLRNEQDESERTNDDGLTQEQVARQDQGFDIELRERTIHQNIAIFKAAQRELYMEGPAHAWWIPKFEVYAPLARKFLAEPRKQYAATLDAIAKYTDTKELDLAKARASDDTATRLDTFSKAVAVEFQAVYDSIEDDVEVESEFLDLDPLRRHAAMIKAVEQLVLQRRFIMNDMLKNGNKAIELGASNMTVVCEAILDIMDVTDAFVRENAIAFAAAVDLGKAVRQLSDRPGKRNEPAPRDVVEELRKRLNRPKRMVVKDEKAA